MTDKPKKLTDPPKGAYCTHRRMRAVSCGECPKPCRWICPDCELTWMWSEGVNG